MRVAMYYANADVRLERMDVPAIGPGEVLVRVGASGLCGSDVMEWYRLDKVPLVLGHEVAGEIAAVGEGVTEWAVGERVVAAHHVPCGDCFLCRGGHETACDTLHRTSFDPGGFAEYVRMPRVNVERGGLHRVPDGVTDEEASFAEPLACVLRAQERARVRPGCRVLVVGSGLSGLLHVAAARALGAGWIFATDVVPYRLEAARRFGADAAFPAHEDVPSRIREAAGDGRLADAVIVTTGRISAIHDALGCVERGGVALIFAPTDPDAALPLDVNRYFWKTDRTITTSYAGSPADHRLALELIRARRIPVAEMVTHRFGLAEAGAAFRLVAAAGDSLKVIIEPQR